MASSSGSPTSSPAPQVPPVSVPNGHFVNGEAGQAMPPHMPPGAGPHPPQHGGYPPYGGYTGPPMGAGQKPMMPPNSAGGYPPPQNAPRFPTGQSIAQQGGPTPTLNSLLQGRNQRLPSPGQPGPAPYGPPPPQQNSGGYPQQQPWPNDPNYASYRQPLPGHRPPYGPSNQQQAPYPGQHPGYHGMPPQHQGYPYPQHGGRYPGPPGAQQGNSASNTQPNYDSSGGNVQGSDDESGGPDPQRVTPGLRPSPSPTGSSSSRSMSPAVGSAPNQRGDGQVPPRPPSNHADLGNGPTPNRMTPQTAQGGYPQPPMGPPAHMMYNPKAAGGPPPSQPGPNQPGQQQMPPYGGQQPGPNYGHYGPRPAYGPAPGGYPGAYGRPNNIPSGYPGYPGGQQYSGSWNNSAAPPPQQQQQQGMMPTSGKGAPPQPGAPGAPVPQRHPGSQPPGPGQYQPRPQHQQMMKGYPPQGGGPPQNNSYGGPPMYNGPGNGGPPMYNMPGMPPPPNSASGMGMPPQGYPGPYPMNNYGPPNTMPSAQGGLSPATATPTGPDGVPLHDETSQQSTLSQSSDRSDGDRQTPKTGSNFMSGAGPQTVGGYPPSSAGPASPHSSAPSPGGSMGSGGHDSGYPRDIASPNWQRTPASPVSSQQQMFNSFGGGSHGGGVPPASPGASYSQGSFAPQSEPTPGKVTKVSKNSETLTRLYEMDENPDRRMFLDRLLSFMEERGSPITQCPTISKNPLDLYKLYLFTKDRGGYLECTKNKTWKDIAAQLGIGASSSGAYTLKKHYGKNLLPFECHFDRGGMDPGPILAQVEAQIKKKSTKAMTMPQPPPVPSPGSQDSRDSYSNSSDPYCGYPTSGGGPISSHNSYPSSRSATTTPPGPNSDRPPSHPGSGHGYPPSSPYGYPPGGPTSGGYPPSAYPPGGAAGPRPSWPPQHTGYAGGPPPQGGPAPPPPSSTPNDMYGRPGWSQQPGGYVPRPPYPGSPGGPPTSASGPTNPAQPPYQDQYQGYGSTGPPTNAPSSPYSGPATPGKPISGGPPPSSPMAPQSPRPGAPPQPPPNAYPYQGQQRPPMYPGGSQPQWQNRYPAPGPGYAPPPQSTSDRSWAPPGSPSGPPRQPGPPGSQWSSDRTTYYGQTGPATWGPSGMMGKSPIRPPYRPDIRGPGPIGPQRQSFPGSRGREMNFPPGCIEATPPYMLKRRKYTKVDVQPVDGWRLVMALKSGLLMESTWALDVINILLFDDNGITYFGLGNMPGLLEALLEHWRASLIAMFGITEDLEVNMDRCGEKRTQQRGRVLEMSKKRRWFERKQSVDEKSVSDSLDFDLGNASNVNPADKCVVLTTMPEDYTKRPRYVDEEVQIDEREDELFVTDENRDWDALDGGFESGMSHWMNGGGNTTVHIVTHFAADLEKARFARTLEDSPNIKEAIKKERTKAEPKVVDVKIEADDDLNNKEHATCDEEPEEDIVEKIQRLTGIVLRDPEVARQRWSKANLEDENYVRDDPSLQLISEANDNLGKRAVCVSTILRNLSFVPGNEYELSKNPTLLAILGRLLLLHHWYPSRPQKQRNYDRGEEEESAESCTSLTGEDEWWWDYLHVIRENVMVILANIAGALDLEPFEEDISRPIFDGLLEWAVSSSAYAQDPFPNVGPGSSVSPQRCAIEALCKLCLLESNVDLMLTTPPFWRLEKLTKMLAKKLYRFEDQVLREFSINLLYYLSAADTGVARTIALSDTTVSLLLSFIEQAEQNAMVIAQQHGVNALRDNPDSMGTSLDMLRRAANTLTNLSRHKDNIPLLARQEQRLLSLVMSQILDQGVASILSHVLYNIGANSAPPPPPPSLPTTPPPSPFSTDKVPAASEVTATTT